MVNYKRICYDICNGKKYASLPISECLNSEQLAQFDALDSLAPPVDDEVRAWNESDSSNHLGFEDEIVNDTELLRHVLAVLVKKNLEERLAFSGEFSENERKRMYELHHGMDK